MKTKRFLRSIATLLAIVTVALSFSSCMVDVAEEGGANKITDAITDALLSLEETINETEKEDTEAPIDGDDDANTPSDDTNDGNTPSDDTNDGNTPSDDTDDGNTPSDDTDDGNTPSDDTDDGNDPSDDTDDNGGSSGGLGELEITKYTVIYATADNGKIEGAQVQQVAHGESTQTVTAVPDEDYIFMKWSDGYANPERTDANVLRSFSVSPIFIHKDTKFSVTYIVKRAGKIVDQTILTAKLGESVSYTAPEPTLAYKFGGWNDGLQTKMRTDVVFGDKEFVGEYTPHSLGVAAISIVTEDGQGIISRDFRECTVSLYNAEDGQCFENLGALIRGRGKSSWDAHEKKGFKLKFDEQLKMLDSSYKSKNWNFISNHADKSFLRNMIAYDMSDAFDGIDYTTTHKFIDVYLNGEYHGLYMLCDDLDVGKGRIEYDKTVHDDPAQNTYFLELGANHKFDDSQCETCITVPSTGNDKYRRYCVKCPDSDDPAYDRNVHLAYIQDYLYQCLSAIGTSNGQNNWEQVCELIDIDSFIDHYIIQEMFANKDAFWCSIFFYKVPNGKLYAGPVWDFDQGAGSLNDLFGDDMTTGKDIYDVRPDTDFSYVNSEYYKTGGSPWVACVNTWYRRLLRYDEFKVMLRERLAELGPVIMQVLDRATTDGSNPNSYYAVYGDVIERNFERWDIMGTFVWPSSPKINSITTVKGQMDYMREWLIERYEVLCNYYGVEQAPT